MAATTGQQPASAFTFLKHGVRLPASRCVLFLQLVAVSAALSTALHLFKYLLQPLGPAAANLIGNCPRDVKVEALATLWNFLADQCWLLLHGAVYLVAFVVVRFVIEIVSVSAAVEVFSGGRKTFLSPLRKVKGNSTGPVFAAALGYLLKVAFFVAIHGLYKAALSHQYSPRVLLRHAILGVFAGLFYPFLELVGAVAIIASVADPGLRATGATGLAWRLMSGGEGHQAALYVNGTLLLGTAVLEACILALVRAVRLPQTAGKVLAAATVTAGVLLQVHKVQCGGSEGWP